MIKLYLTALAVLAFTFSHAQEAINALHFDGVDDYVTAPLPNYMDNLDTQDLTVTAWVNPDAANFQRIFFAQVDVNTYLCMAMNPSGELIGYLNIDGTNHSIQTIGTLSTGSWQHVALSWEANTQTLVAFINGEEQQNAQGVFVSSTGTDGVFTIGARTDGNQFFTGSIDELTFWNMTMTACELQKHLSATVMGNETNLLDAYSFNEGIANDNNTGVTTATNSANSANDGTLNNFALAGTTSNWITSNASITHQWGNWDFISADNSVLTAAIGNTPAATFQWIDCTTNTDIAGETTPTYTPSGPGYYALVMQFLDCRDTTDCFDFTTIGIAEEEAFNIQLSPNPGHDQLTITLNNVDDALVEVYNMSGQIVLKEQVNNAVSLQLNTSQLAADLYIVRVTTMNRVYTERWVKH